MTFSARTGRCCGRGWRRRPGSRWTTPGHANAVCTQIGNDNFAWFGTTGSKSRLNFLELLRAGYTDYVVNAAALEYMREHDLAGPVIRHLAGHPQRQFADQAAWQGHLERLGITMLQVT